MKKFYHFSFLSLSVVTCLNFAACSDHDDEPDDKVIVESKVIGFQNAASVMASDAYGSNLYYGAEHQIKFGYIANIYGDTYAQFPVNYGYTYDADFNMVWGYSLYLGGFAVSKYHDMENGTYENQLSVYNESSPSGGNFIVAFGASTISDPSSATLQDYAECAHVYITNINGYNPTQPGKPDSYVYGDDEDAFFRSVWINNTTYDFLTMKNGNPYASALNEENKGWFKVQFIAFDDDKKNAKPVGCIEAYLANFDKNQADGYIGIIDEWIKVDLSPLPECSILVINFVGSDTGEFGLNTPKYCALDNFEISVRKD